MKIKCYIACSIIGAVATIISACSLDCIEELYFYIILLGFAGFGLLISGLFGIAYEIDRLEKRNSKFRRNREITFQQWKSCEIRKGKK